MAQEQNVDARLDRLERLIEGLVARLDAEAGQAQQQTETLRAGQAEAREQTALIKAEQQAMRAQADAVRFLILLALPKVGMFHVKHRIPAFLEGV